jgi:hypothetical protein
MVRSSFNVDVSGEQARYQHIPGAPPGSRVDLLHDFVDDFAANLNSK